MPWYYELYLVWATVFLGIIVLCVIGGVFALAIQGREGWSSSLNELILATAVIGLFGPFLLASVPFVAIYRLVTDT